MVTIYITAKARRELLNWLNEQGYSVFTMEPDETFDSPINWHTDIFYCQLGNTIFSGDSSQLSTKYPGDVLYNGCSTGKYFIHNTKYTYPQLLEAAKSTGHTVIHVPQGYARCSILPVNEDSIITADWGVAKICISAGINDLLIRPGHIQLTGFNYGFIGGCGGRIGDTVVFHGNLSEHPDGNSIREFIHQRGLKIKDFPEFPLTDIGSILTEGDI